MHLHHLMHILLPILIISTRATTNAVASGSECVFNDDYCDCGQDEPLTSACPSSVFSCKFSFSKELNLKSSSDELRKLLEKVPEKVPSSFVLDGVCDCCDCSDETGGWIPLVDTCKAAMKALTKAADNEAKALQKGLAVRLKLIENAKLKKIEKSRSLSKNIEDRDLLQLSLISIKAELEKALEREKLEFELKETKRAETCREITELASEKTLNEKLRADNSRLESEIADLKSNYSSFFEAMKAFAPPEEMAKFDLNPPQDPVSDTPSSDAATLQEQTDNVVIDASLDPTSPENQQTVHDQEKVQKDPEFTLNCLGRLFGVCIPTNLVPLTKYLGLIKDSSSIQKSINEHTSKINSLEREINSLQEIRDYGPDDAWLAVDGECMSLRVIEYLYEVCIFGEATQKNDDNSVSIGRFTNFDPTTYLTMMFENGQGCWNGPSRSIRVDFECGPVMKLIDVTEPQMCTYTAKAQSPLACSSESHTNAHSEL